jgi:hypothetical protein
MNGLTRSVSRWTTDDEGNASAAGGLLGAVVGGTTLALFCSVSLEAVLPVLVVVAGQAFNLLVDRPD